MIDHLTLRRRRLAGLVWGVCPLLLTAGCQTNSPGSPGSPVAGPVANEPPAVEVVYELPEEVSGQPVIERVTLRPVAQHPAETFTAQQTVVRGQRNGPDQPFTFTVSINGQMPVPEEIVALMPPSEWRVASVTDGAGRPLALSAATNRRNTASRGLTDSSIIWRAASNQGRNLRGGDWRVQLSVDGLATLPESFGRIKATTQAVVANRVERIELPIPALDESVEVVPGLTLTTRRQDRTSSLAELYFSVAGDGFDRESSFPYLVTVDRAPNVANAQTARFQSRQDNPGAPMIFQFQTAPSPIDPSEATPPPVAVVHVCHGFSNQEVEVVIGRFPLLQNGLVSP